MNVESNIKTVAGVENVFADIESGEVIIDGSSVDIEKVKSAVEGVGYTFAGLVE